MVQADLLRVRIELRRLAPVEDMSRKPPSVWIKASAYQTRPYRKLGASDLWMPLHTSCTWTSYIQPSGIAVDQFPYLNGGAFSQTNRVVKIRVGTAFLRVHLHEP
jgi:hypothetical protein